MLILRQMTQRACGCGSAGWGDGRISIAFLSLRAIDHEQPPPARDRARPDPLGARWSPRVLTRSFPHAQHRVHASWCEPIFVQVDHQGPTHRSKLLQHALRGLDRLGSDLLRSCVGHLTDHIGRTPRAQSGPRASAPRRPVSASLRTPTSTSPPSPAPRRLSRGSTAPSGPLNHTTLPAIPQYLPASRLPHPRRSSRSSLVPSPG